jgi:D-sedoheptulose 7-phosphate isomerase
MLDRETIKSFLGGAAMAVISLKEESDKIGQAVDVLVAALKSGGKVLTCGNGGSTCEAAHLAEELLGRYAKIRKPFAAINLAGDSSVLTCIGNDYGFEYIFSRQVEALGKPGDVLVAFSTSGDSVNVCLAVSQAKELGLKTIALVGCRESGGTPEGGRLSKLADIAIKVGSVDSAHIQEAHQVLLHLFLEEIEKETGN